MFDDLPPDLERLRTLRVWHAMWLRRIDRKISQVVQRQAEQDRGRRAKPRPAEWIVELGIGTGRPPTQVHRGSCYMAGKRHHPISRDEARSLLAAGTSTCTHCRPDRDLGIIGLASRDTAVRARAASPGTGYERAPANVWPGLDPQRV
ncbi:DUF6233 domain-containing protein [Streptomyces sp. NPDC055692]|uniref:DUF6233 domain-containing protein n=1 Tax=Streptomyces sp. NPDC055692 TaxID=3155683 RepID=UPI003422EFAC